jgi:putative transferase (TIGR04331 family)
LTTRYLITTADERTWIVDRPVLFLGEWCRRYDRRHVWERMDAQTAAPFGTRAEQRAQAIEYVHRLSSQLLEELAAALNRFHGATHSVRYWHILLGSWLRRYVAICFNRYFALEHALQNYDVSGTRILDFTNYSLAGADSLALVLISDDPVWNHVFYSKILRYWGYGQAESVPADAQPEPDRVPAAEGSDAKRTLGARGFLSNFVTKLLPRFHRRRDAFIVNSYLPRQVEISLQIHLGQCPQLWRSPALTSVPAQPEQRRRLGFERKDGQSFEQFVRLQLPDVIPSCYVEGYGQLIRQVESLHWPKAPKFIFTSNNFDTDEIFKAWVASKTEQSVPYFTGQHGNNYGTLLGSEQRPESVTCDRFFTWGWQNDSRKDLPAFIFKLAGGRLRGGASGGGLLLIETCLPHQIETWDVTAEFAIYQEEQFRFVAALPAAIKAQLTVRLLGDYKRRSWCEELRWRERCPDIRLERGAARIADLIAGSRLVVHSYDSTGILETLASDIPTLCFWSGGFDHLMLNARPYYELLARAGIIADSPEQAGEFVASRWDHVDEWWRSEEVQHARRSFCERYARMEPRPVRTMKRLLLESVAAFEHAEQS